MNRKQSIWTMPKKKGILFNVRIALAMCQALCQIASQTFTRLSLG